MLSLDILMGVRHGFELSDPFCVLDSIARRHLGSALEPVIQPTKSKPTLPVCSEVLELLGAGCYLV